MTTKSGHFSKSLAVVTLAIEAKNGEGVDVATKFKKGKAILTWTVLCAQCGAQHCSQ